MNQKLRFQGKDTAVARINVKPRGRDCAGKQTTRAKPRRGPKMEYPKKDQKGLTESIAESSIRR